MRIRQLFGISLIGVLACGRMGFDPGMPDRVDSGPSRTDVTDTLDAQAVGGFECNDPRFDINASNGVDLYDLAALDACDNGPDIPHNGSWTCSCLDSDDDGDVDKLDRDRLLACFGKIGEAARTCDDLL